MEPEKKIQTGIRLSPSLYRAVKLIAWESETSISAVVERAIRGLLDLPKSARFGKRAAK